MKVTKSFLTLWVSQMIANPSFIADARLTGDIVGLAANGDIEALKQVLEIYKDYIDVPKQPTYFNIAPNAPDNIIRRITANLSLESKRESIEEVLRIINAGEFIIE